MSEERQVFRSVEARIRWHRNQAMAIQELAADVEANALPEFQGMAEIQRIDYVEELRQGALKNLQVAAEFERGIGIE